MGFVDGWLAPTLNSVKSFHCILIGLATDIPMLQSPAEMVQMVQFL